MRYVIIGGGVAGTTAAQELRKADKDCEITLVSEEHHPLYSRVLLPHFMKGKVPRERVFLKKESWYQEENIEWLRGVTVTRLDPKNKFVELSNGREYPYDKLLIATGGDVRHVDDDIRGVSYFRTLDDADHVLQLIAEQETPKGAVYGGGFIACEYINLFQHFAIPTEVVHRGDHFWNQSLIPESGELITKKLKESGVQLASNNEIETLEGSTELSGFTTQQGSHEATILGIGIGITPDFSWIQNAGIEVGSGIYSNEYLETNVQDIYTAGDVAEFFDVTVGRRRVVGNWMNAMTQGRIVAKNMLGEQTEFRLVSSYATNVLGLEIIFVGDVEKKSADNIHVVGSVESGGITQIFERDNRVVGAVLVGRNLDRPIVTQAIKEERSFEELTFTEK